MSAFYVGQRVRLNFPPSPAHGQETRIVELNLPGMDEGRPFIGHMVDILVPSDEADYPGERYGFEPHELEPILYDGNQLVSWSDCVWQPEGLSA